MGKQHGYSEYQSTGIDWCGKVPAHWALVPCRSAVEHVVEKNHDGKVQNYLSVMANVGVIPYEEKGDIGNKKPDDLSKCKLVRKGQLVINSMNYSIGSYGMSDYDGVCSPVYIILQANTDTLHKRFALRVFENTPFQKHLATFGNGILAHRAAIGWDDIKGQYIPVPPMEEQEKILHFLDHETAKIDTLIDKQQQLIKLLKEKRQAVISHAVTKGLNPQAPMKDSGVEWCDYIPEHWRIGKLGYFAHVGNGATPSRENQSFWSGGTIGWLNSSKVNDVIIREADQFITPLALAQTSVQPVKANDLVVAITGEGQTRGRVAICQLEATINQHLASIQIYDDCLHHEFLFLWLSANYERIRFESTGAGSTKGAITCGDIKSYPIVIAPLSEQKEIINHIKLQNQRFSNLISKAENQVQLLKEYRTALISAAVTGKIDVRNWQAPTSQEQALEQTA